MTSFASLMALSKTQTKQAQVAVESQLAERKRKEAEQRRQQEEREQREREQEKKLRLKKLQEDQRQRERLEKLQAERKAREAALQKREDEQRDALRYGPKKAKSGAPGTSGSKQGSSTSDGARRRREGDDSDLEGGGGALTREEIRQRKVQQEQRKIYQISKRSATSIGRAYSKAGLRLPGGAVNIVTNKGGHTAGEQQSPASGRGTKERLAALPNTLVKLNTQKRDKRTEDEIQMQVRAKRQVLEGADAASFDDWFGDKKKEKQVSPRPPAPTSSSPPSLPMTSAVRPTASAAISTSASASTSQKHDSRAQKPFFSKSTTSTLKAAVSTPRGGSSDVHSSTSKYPKMTKSSSAPSAPSSRPPPRPPAAYPPVQSARKRPRSPSYDESPSPPPPSKKRGSARHQEDFDDPNDVRNAIWEMFGKKRSNYTNIDVYSDDEDMEADAYALEYEEAKSARIAKMEDTRALEEERRHDDEKRRRKKEKERAAARGH